MAHRALKRFATGIGPVVMLVAVLAATLTLMSVATQNSARFSETYLPILALNALILLTLGALIAWNLASLIKQVRRRLAGARFTGRMVSLFVLLAVTPVLVVYGFSLQFLLRGVDSWFDVRIEKALDDALELSRTSLGVRMRELLKQTELIAAELAPVSDGLAALTLDDARFMSGASELTLMAPRGRIIASTSADPSSIVPSTPDEAILMQLKQAQNYIGLDPIGDGALHIRVVVRVPGTAPTGEPRILQALFPVSERMNTLADSVQTAYAKYRELVYLREPLKLSFALTLSLVLLLSLAAAVWAAFFSARRLVAPLRDLAEGTRAVAAGDYETRLRQPGSDELGFLVESFNEMTRKLARARDETRESQRQLEESRAYLEAVLSRLSSGVVTLDHAGEVRTANHAAEHILGARLEAATSLAELAARHPRLRALADAIEPHLGASESDWREEIVLFGASGRQVLMCHGTPLPASGHSVPGHVIVVDDVTALIQAQRDAAWSEVARRLAHEIKNPLTPIQLSAERLRHKYLRKMSQTDAEALDRLTRTIVQQVEAMKEMVNAFSEYARTPALEAKAVDLNALVGDVVELYRAEPRNALRTELESRLPPLEADPARLRQLLHNLIKNALEASERRGRPAVTIGTRLASDSGKRYAELVVSDRGSGFASEIIEQAFEPYVTTKPKGTGLGLAIVKKIAEEHGGTVRVENNPEGGASVFVRLPMPAGAGGLLEGRRLEAV